MDEATIDLLKRTHEALYDLNDAVTSDRGGSPNHPLVAEIDAVLHEAGCEKIRGYRGGDFYIREPDPRRDARVR